jgi:hypothetical protein
MNRSFYVDNLSMEDFKRYIEERDEEIKNGTLIKNLPDAYPRGTMDYYWGKSMIGALEYNEFGVNRIKESQKMFPNHLVFVQVLSWRC